MAVRALHGFVLLAAGSRFVDATFSFRGSAQVSEQTVQIALAEELADQKHRVPIFEEALGTMYASLPKNDEGTLTHQTVRYALHRYFLSQHGWFIRGLEPKNSGYVPPPGKVLFVKEWVPTYLQDSLEKLGAGGLNLHGVAILAASLEDLIHVELRERMKLVYQLHHQPETNVSLKEAEDLLYTYVITFVLGNNFTLSDDTLLTRKRRAFAKKYRGYDRTMKWFVGVLGSYFGPLLRQRVIGPDSIDFDTSVEAVYQIAESYHIYNDNECEDLRGTLKELEGKRAGRVRLSTFYNTSFSSHWKFVEKADYLRVLGALDESDPKAPSVIISNYVLSRPNCLDASNLFSVCCRNTCDELLSSLEKELGTHSVTPSLLAPLLANLSSRHVSAPRELPDLLLSRLEDIAANHGGEVPLHGRLFGQWMHHAYPLECPFPQERASVNPETYEEWTREDKDVSATKEEMQEHMDNDLCAVDARGRVECEEESADLPWSMTEDILHSYQGSPATQGEVERRELHGTEELPRVQHTRWRVGAVFAVPLLSVLYVARRFDVGRGKRERLAI